MQEKEEESRALVLRVQSSFILRNTPDNDRVIQWKKINLMEREHKNVEPLLTVLHALQKINLILLYDLSEMTAKGESKLE